MMQPASPCSRLCADGPQVVGLPPPEQRWLIAPFMLVASLWVWISEGLVQPASGLIAPMSAAAGALCIAILCWVKVRRDNRHRKRAFLEALEGLDLATLQQSAVSPKVDDESRQLLVTYLNQRYPGW